MTTTISKQEQQQQQQQQQQQHVQHQQQQQPLLTSDSVAIPIAADLQFDTLNNNNNNNNNGSPVDQAVGPSSDEPQKRRSLLNFKSLDFHLKSLYSGLRSHSGSGTGTTPPSLQPPNSSIPAVDVQTQRRMPYLRVESVDPEEQRGPVIHSGHSPSFLSPYSGGGGGGGGGTGGAVSLQLPSADGGTIRRSSTSDIVNCKRGGGAGGTASAQDSRRPSTSDLLRKARERKGSEARMGRSVSHSGLTRGGPGGGGGGLGGRRTSMAF